MADRDRAGAIRQQILDLVAEYTKVAHAPAAFVPGESKVPYAGRVFDAHEITNLVDSSLEFWLTAGPWGTKLEKAMRRLFGSPDFLLVNSGSSANLTMVSTLCSPMVERRLEPGDEVITPAVTFPTTLTPIVQNGLIPVFVDCELGTYNVDPARVEAAIGPRTRAMVIPHTLGNPFDLGRLTALAERHGLWLLEDCCDALGSTWGGRRVGTFGAMASLSFYPAHHMTMGEGGGVVINRGGLTRAAQSIRDWGRDCWCPPGESNTCGKRFDWQLGDLPAGYDHKYIYSNLGYNLKVTDMQAAVGLAQLDKLADFCAKRRANFRRLYDGLQPVADRLVLPRWLPDADPAWFAFPVTVTDRVDRRALVQFLESRKIETRMIFAGNVLRQPGFRSIPHRVVGDLTVTDRVMTDTFFVGVYPGLTPAMLDWVVESFLAFFQR